MPQEASFALTEDQFQEGAKKGYWSVLDSYSILAAMSPLGKEHFGFVTSFADKGLAQYQPGYMQVSTLGAIPKEVIEVTGIADAPNGPKGTSKLVEFVWRWDPKGLPNDALGFLPNPKNSQSLVLQLFDDGWRIAHRNSRNINAHVGRPDRLKRLVMRARNYSLDSITISGRYAAFFANGSAITPIESCRWRLGVRNRSS